MQGRSKRILASGGRASVSLSTHPNEMRFRGVLVRLDEPSTKPPNGSDGHKIYLSSELAKEKLSTLIGMGLNYAPSLDTHAQRRKVGVIKKAWIKGKDLWVSGVIWKHDFPEATKDLKRSDLGMSMELGKVSVEDMHANVWKLDDFYFLGATILRKNAAAYYKTLAIAAKAERSQQMAQKVVKTKGKVVEMTPERIASIAARAATAAIKKEFDPQFKTMTESLSALSERVEEMDIAASLAGVEEDVADLTIDADEDTEEVTACAKCGKDHGEEEACDMKAKKHDEEDDDEDGDEDDDMESEGIDKGDLEEMGPDGAEDEDDQPGSLNKGTKNRGHDGAGEDAKKTGPHKSMGVTGAAALKVLRKAVKTLSAQIQAAREENRELKKQLAKFQKVVKASATDVNRRSVTPEMSGLMAKAGLDPDEFRQSGQKLTPADVDSMLAAAGVDLPTVKRIELKNQFMRAGFMEEGHVQRNGAGR